MPAVLVHGVADTFHVWNATRARLGRADVVALALPGFNSPVPEGFDATKEAYLDWLIEEVEKLGEPVDLVGHDWGCILTARLASVRPELVRTWTGISGPVDAEYDWHVFAKIWQTPGEGERWMRELDLDAFAEQLAGFAMPVDDARRSVRFIDDTMKDCILRLYRSAVQVGREWEPGLTGVTSRSLVLWGLDDPFLPNVFADHLGKATRADAVVKLRCGHWLPLEQPQAVVRELEAHWNQ